MIQAMHTLLYCYDADKERAFIRDVRDDGFGLTIDPQIPGGRAVMVYQPRYDPPAFGGE